MSHPVTRHYYEFKNMARQTPQGPMISRYDKAQKNSYDKLTAEAALIKVTIDKNKDNKIDFIEYLQYKNAQDPIIMPYSSVRFSKPDHALHPSDAAPEVETTYHESPFKIDKEFIQGYALLAPLLIEPEFDQLCREHGLFTMIRMAQALQTKANLRDVFFTLKDVLRAAIGSGKITERQVINGIFALVASGKRGAMETLRQLSAWMQQGHIRPVLDHEVFYKMIEVLEAAGGESEAALTIVRRVINDLLLAARKQHNTGIVPAVFKRSARPQDIIKLVASNFRMIFKCVKQAEDKQALIKGTLLRLAGSMGRDMATFETYCEGFIQLIDYADKCLAVVFRDGIPKNIVLITDSPERFMDLVKLAQHADIHTGSLLSDTIPELHTLMRSSPEHYRLVIKGLRRILDDVHERTLSNVLSVVIPRLSKQLTAHPERFMDHIDMIIEAENHITQLVLNTLPILDPFMYQSPEHFATCVKKLIQLSDATRGYYHPLFSKLIPVFKPLLTRDLPTFEIVIDRIISMVKVMEKRGAEISYRSYRIRGSYALAIKKSQQFYGTGLSLIDKDLPSISSLLNKNVHYYQAIMGMIEQLIQAGRGDSVHLVIQKFFVPYEGLLLHDQAALDGMITIIKALGKKALDLFQPGAGDQAFVDALIKRKVCFQEMVVLAPVIKGDLIPVMQYLLPAYREQLRTDVQWNTLFPLIKQSILEISKEKEGPWYSFVPKQTQHVYRYGLPLFREKLSDAELWRRQIGPIQKDLIIFEEVTRDTQWKFFRSQKNAVRQHATWELFCCILPALVVRPLPKDPDAVLWRVRPETVAADISWLLSTYGRSKARMFMQHVLPQLMPMLGTQSVWEKYFRPVAKDIAALADTLEDDQQAAMFEDLLRMVIPLLDTPEKWQAHFPRVLAVFTECPAGFFTKKLYPSRYSVSQDSKTTVISKDGHARLERQPVVEIPDHFFMYQYGLGTIAPLANRSIDTFIPCLSSLITVTQGSGAAHQDLFQYTYPAYRSFLTRDLESLLRYNALFVRMSRHAGYYTEQIFSQVLPRLRAHVHTPQEFEALLMYLTERMEREKHGSHRTVRDFLHTVQSMHRADIVRIVRHRPAAISGR